MSIGMPPSASTSMFGSSRLAMAEAKLVVRYWARPPLSISSSFGGIGGGGRSFRYRVDTTISCLKPAFGSIEAAMMQNRQWIRTKNRKRSFNQESAIAPACCASELWNVQGFVNTNHRNAETFCLRILPR